MPAEKELSESPDLTKVRFLFVRLDEQRSLREEGGYTRPIPSIHRWRYSPFRALASLIRRLNSSLFSALLHPLIPSSCNASLWTTFPHLVLGLPTGLWYGSFRSKPFFGIFSSSIRIIWPAHSNFLNFMSSTMFSSTRPIARAHFGCCCRHKET